MKKLNIAFFTVLIVMFSFNTIFAVQYKGDMNGDSKINILDVRLLLQEYINNNR